MSVIGSSILAGASGSAGGDKVYVDDVFSTTLYTGNDVNGRQVPTGIDNTDKSLVWVKLRSDSSGHQLFDSERGNGTHYLNSTNNGSEGGYSSSGMQSFDTNGFTTGNQSALNGSSNKTYVAWNFKAAPGFFDVVTFQGDGTTGRQIPHALGSEPGLIICKAVDQTVSWAVRHNSIPTKMLLLDSTNAQSNAQDLAGTNTADYFNVSYSSGYVNTSGINYVAYIFAHDDAQFGTGGDESIIKCGTYEGLTYPNYKQIDLGFEPQLVLIKNADASSNWTIRDSMRVGQVLRPNTSDNEVDENELLRITSTGFEVRGGSTDFGVNSNTYIYMAIRRPNKPPELATEVFAIDTRAGTSPTPPTYKSDFPVDWVWERRSDTTNNWGSRNRLTGKSEEIDLNLSNAKSNNTNTRIEFDRNDGLGTDTSAVSTQYAWMFKRAPGFMDVVTYTGTGTNSAGTAQVVNHNLGVTPELVIVKNRDYTKAFFVWSSYMTEQYRMQLDDTAQESSGGETYWQANSTFTATQFGLGYGVNTNRSPDKHVAYLFASLAGISKVGTYSGNTGNNVDVDCGFTAGARFILIKRTDSSGDWYVWDTTRGIVSGNDPYLLLNSTAAQVTNTDYIDPYIYGFTVTASAPAALNATGGTYIFLAIA